MLLSDLRVAGKDLRGGVGGRGGAEAGITASRPTPLDLLAENQNHWSHS